MAGDGLLETSETTQKRKVTWHVFCLLVRICVRSDHLETYSFRLIFVCSLLNIMAVNLQQVAELLNASLDPAQSRQGKWSQITCEVL
jgi:hypothetical protein